MTIRNNAFRTGRNGDTEEGTWSIVWIHPFKDYNGRVARLLTNLLLLNLGLPILTVKAETGKDRDKYIEAMKAADKNDLSKLENLLAKALEKNLRKVQETRSKIK